MKEKIVKKIDLTATFRSLDVGESIRISKRFNYNSVKSATRRLRITEGIVLRMSQDERFYTITREEVNHDNGATTSADIKKA